MSGYTVPDANDVREEAHEVLTDALVGLGGTADAPTVAESRNLIRATAERLLDLADHWGEQESRVRGASEQEQ